MKKKGTLEKLDVSSFTHLCFFPLFLAEDPSALSEFLSPLIFFSISRNPSIRFALTHPCATGQYRLVLYTAICSALVRFFLRIFHYATWIRENTRENVQWECNIDHDNVFHSRSDSGCNARLSADQCRRTRRSESWSTRSETLFTLLRDTDRANRTDGTNKATSETQVMCVVWLAQVQIHGDG